MSVGYRERMNWARNAYGDLNGFAKVDFEAPFGVGLEVVRDDLLLFDDGDLIA